MIDKKQARAFAGYLREYLNIFWLRPGTAIWRAYDTMVLNGLDWTTGPRLELGCGDGVNSFILCGGKFGIGFDSFLSVRDLTPEEFFLGKKDMYDRPFTRKRLIKIERKPSRKFDYGLDFKANLLQKAKRLNLYGNLVRHDLNQPLCLKDRSAGIIYSNALYWLDDISSVLRQLRAALKDDGKIVALLPSPVLKKYYIYEKYLKTGQPIYKILDMGRYGCIKHLYTHEEWESIFDDCGLKIKSSVNYLSGRFIEMSEIDIRPLSNVLAVMANKLSPRQRNESKKKWIDTLMYLIMPMFENGFLSDPGGEQTFFMFELIKK